MKHDITSIATNFRLDGRLLDAGPLGSGHINDTFNLTCETDGPQKRYVLQRINHRVFRNPPAMMDNIRRVTAHIRRKLQDQGDELASRQLEVIETEEGGGCFKDERGNYWRVYNRVENAVTYDKLESAETAREATRMFGWFQKMLIDLPGPELHETICDFHNTPKRLIDFQQVLKEDAFNHAKDAGPEIEFLFENAEICDVLVNLVESGDMPVRIAHNDAKINNVMFDKDTNKGVCVIDLDTVMPGLSIYDFGDLVRTAATSAEEDERDLSRVALDPRLFEALVRGFAGQAGEFLTAVEKEHLVFAAKLITFEQAIRFLADYLSGDVYYRIHREGHNLDRSRTQIKLVRSIAEQAEALNQTVEKVFQGID